MVLSRLERQNKKHKKLEESLKRIKIKTTGKEKMKPFVYTTVRLLSLASQGTIDQKILSSLVGANQIDLILEGGGLVELGREPVWS